MANVVNRSGKPRTIRMVIDSPPLYHDPVTGGYWPMYDGHVKCFFSMIRKSFDLHIPLFRSVFVQIGFLSRPVFVQIGLLFLTTSPKHNTTNIPL